MRELRVPEWTARHWIEVERAQLANWVRAAAQTIGQTPTRRPGLRALRAIARTAGLDRDFSARPRSGGQVPTSDARHLSGLLSAGWRFTPLDGLWEARSPEGVAVLVRPHDAESRDLCSLFETFVRSDYGTSFPGWNVVDVGGGNGDSALCFATRGAARVIVAEPDPRSLRLLRRNVALNPRLPAIEVVEAAVGERSGWLDFPLGERYSDRPDAERARPPGGVVRVAVVPLDELIERCSSVDLLKVDVEGAEYPILRALSSPAWARIRSIRLEFHHGVQDLGTIIASHGFEVAAAPGVDQGLLYAQRA